jgi:hypothetical protein
MASPGATYNMASDSTVNGVKDKGTEMSQSCVCIDKIVKAEGRNLELLKEVTVICQPIIIYSRDYHGLLDRAKQLQRSRRRD